MATPEWVGEVLLGTLTLGGIRQAFQFDQSLLQVTVNPQGNTVHDTLALGFGRSDTIRAGNKFSKERSESLLTLLQWEINLHKGTWMSG
ncbi:hypothetical protein ColLi_03170 [Colletotrichum liriopes]|uniref:Uncharacterized protein n=1 Tax=Colletotrichum liriopes TaxID=708192 RepID=A0AA37GGM3_9PEZI|nr:hypothetical protein ColLi_03170 [Colletotrichum liriopes]